MYAELIESVKQIIQRWVEEYHPELRIGCDMRPVFPVWKLAHFTLPNPQPLGEIQFAELEHVSWTEGEYIDQLKRWIGGIASGIAPFYAT
jgi:hypothetical protein